jgi:outer membrane protein
MRVRWVFPCPGWLWNGLVAVVALAWALGGAPAGAGAQDTPEPTPPPLSLEDALQAGLEANHGIRLARNRLRIDETERAVARAGFLPRLDLTAFQIREGELEWERGTIEGERIRSGSDELGMGVELEWGALDGLASLSNHAYYREQERLGSVELQVAVEATAGAIIEAYYAMAREQQILSTLLDAVAFSEERLDIAETMRELGATTEYEVILSRTDLNSDRAAVLRQEAVVEEARLGLLELLGMPSHVRFEVASEIPEPRDLDPDELLAGREDGSRELVAAEHLLRMSEYEHQRLQRERLPSLSVRAGYAWNRADPRFGLGSPMGDRGFTLGLTASVPVFDGGDRRNRANVARLEVEDREIQLAERRASLEVELRTALTRYANGRVLAELEQENLELALEGLRIALEQFRLSSITSIQLRETQRTVLDTDARLITAQFEAKVAETEVLRLVGRLLESLNLPLPGEGS